MNNNLRSTPPPAVRVCFAEPCLGKTTSEPCPSTEMTEGSGTSPHTDRPYSMKGIMNQKEKHQQQEVTNRGNRSPTLIDTRSGHGLILHSEFDLDPARSPPIFMKRGSHGSGLGFSFSWLCSVITLAHHYLSCVCLPYISSWEGLHAGSSLEPLSLVTYWYERTLFGCAGVHRPAMDPLVGSCMVSSSLGYASISSWLTASPVSLRHPMMDRLSAFPASSREVVSGSRIGGLSLLARPDWTPKTYWPMTS